ncbi:MAG: hypothetical protein R2705_23245 [Ilumatobacteraceae bacterium]
MSLEVLAVALWSTSNLLAALLALSGTLFYVFVYTLWLGADGVPAEHRHRRPPGRAGPRRMGGGHQLPRLGAGDPVRHHLPVDASPFPGPWRSDTPRTIAADVPMLLRWC